MLRVSAQMTEQSVNLQGVHGNAQAATQTVRWGAELIAFAHALVARDEPELDRARDRLREVAGSAVLVDAAGVAANFQRMVRIADSTGIPVDDLQSELGQGVRAELDLQRFPSAQHSMGGG